MKLEEYNQLSTKSRIGISVDSDSLEDLETVQGYKYLCEEFRPSKLTKTNSFNVMLEQFYIAKKYIDGSASRLYHVYRVSDWILVCPSTLGKEETIRLIWRKYELGT